MTVVVVSGLHLTCVNSTTVVFVSGLHFTRGHQVLGQSASGPPCGSLR